MNDLVAKIKRGVRRRLTRLVPDRQRIIQMYRKANGRSPNLDDPKDLSEKLCWLKLNYLTPLQMHCVDKVAARDYVLNTIGEAHVVPLLFQTDDVADIRPEKIPDKQFVLKTTHDSGGVVICWDRDTFDWARAREFLTRRLRQNYALETRERAYDGVPRRIIAEQLLPSSVEAPLNDFKIWCFAGRVEMIQLGFVQQAFDETGFEAAKGERPQVVHAYYTRNWEKTDLKLLYPMWQGDAPPPKNLDQMIKVAEQIAAPFPFVRVDLYNLDGQIWFGETTFYPLGGHVRFERDADERRLGDLLALPDPVDVAAVLQTR